MSDAQRDAARAQLKLQAQTTVEPTLSDPEIEDLLDQALRVTATGAPGALVYAWTAEHVYGYGAVVLPTKRNGHRYLCLEGGTAGAAEPVWPKARGAVITEGADEPPLRWQEAGPDYANVYDVRRAVHAAWLLKAAKASANYSGTVEGDRFEYQQVYDHCQQMAARFAPLRFS